MIDDNATRAPRTIVADAIDRIYRRGLTTASGGNVSLRDPDGSIWITPARLDKGALRSEDVVCVRNDGTVDGDHVPSSELPFHVAILRAHPDLHAVVHAHPAGLTAWAACHRVPDLAVLPDAAAICGPVASVEYELTGTDRLARRIGDAFAGGLGGALLLNHGVVVAGGEMDEALERLEVLDAAAQTIARAAALRGPRVASPGTAVADPGEALPTARPEAAFDEGEWELRATICRFVRRAQDRGLVIGSTARASIRRDAGAVLITPVRTDAERLEPEEIRLVPANVPTADHAGDRHLDLHRAVYATHEHVHAIITAAPVAATAFALADTDLDCRALSESYLVLGHVPRVPWTTHRDDPVTAAGAVSAATPAALLEHRGVLATGGSLLEAFDVLEVLESTAAALIEARLVGEATRIGDEDVADLEALR